jgi:hypothetical protein
MGQLFFPQTRKLVRIFGKFGMVGYEFANPDLLQLGQKLVLSAQQPVPNNNDALFVRKAVRAAQREIPVLRAWRNFDFGHLELLVTGNFVSIPPHQFVPLAEPPLTMSPADAAHNMRSLLSWMMGQKGAVVENSRAEPTLRIHSFGASSRPSEELSFSMQNGLVGVFISRKKSI